MIKQLHYLLYIYSIINEHGEIQQTYKKILFYINIKNVTKFNWHGQKKKAGERERESINNVD